jgi:hypothetical protein
MSGKFGVAERLAASQEGLRSMESVSYTTGEYIEKYNCIEECYVGRPERKDR